MSEKFPDPLVRQRLFPEPGQVFAFKPVALSDAIASALVVVDTNVLLVPYATGQASLAQIRQAFERLKSGNQLRIPGQVAREFADNRAEKLKSLFQQLSRNRDVKLPMSDYPLLEGIPAYAEVASYEKELGDIFGKYRKAISTLLDTVSAWRWDDPVSSIYRELFTSDIIVEPDFKPEGLLEDLKYRQEHRIPPGYKDAGNEYWGIGDLLVWKAVLKIGEDTKNDVIFVSGDEKSDWRYRSENLPLYPRFELVEEYRRASGGRSLIIITFAQLLEQFGAPEKVLAEVRQEESLASKASSDEAPLEIPPLTLREYLQRRYRNRAAAERSRHYHKLSGELSRAGIFDLDALDTMLDSTKETLHLVEEKWRGSSGGQFTDVGAVRASLGLPRLP